MYSGAAQINYTVIMGLLHMAAGDAVRIGTIYTEFREVLFRFAKICRKKADELKEAWNAGNIVLVSKLLKDSEAAARSCRELTIEVENIKGLTNDPVEKAYIRMIKALSKELT